MKASHAAVAIVLATAIPLGVLAQQTQPPSAPGPPGGGPGRFQRARAEARTAAMNDLSADHRARVQAIVDQVNAGTLDDLRTARQQIAAIITPDEANAVLRERDAMLQAQGVATPEPTPNTRPGARGARLLPSAAPRHPELIEAAAFLLAAAMTPGRIRALQGR
jgi:Spy/CpxP family protein refolding chaperone